MVARQSLPRCLTVPNPKHQRHPKRQKAPKTPTHHKPTPSKTPKTPKAPKAPKQPKHNSTAQPRPRKINQPVPVGDDLATIGYQEATALRYLWYSYAAYCDAGDITNWSCQWCTGDDYTLEQVSTVYDAPSDTFGFIGYNDAHNEIVVSYRGTQPTSLTNWITDLSFAKTDLNFAGVNGAHVHSGFYNSYLAVAPDTQSAVFALQSQFPSANIYFTGHSLGGALATLGTLDAVVAWGLPGTSMGHITFGSPRVGDATFASAFTQYVGTSNHFRLVNDDDLVPHLPMELMGFHHISTEVWLHGDSAQICNSSGEDPSCSDSVLGISVYDHIHYFGYLQTC